MIGNSISISSQLQYNAYNTATLTKCLRPRNNCPFFLRPKALPLLTIPIGIQPAVTRIYERQQTPRAARCKSFEFQLVETHIVSLLQCYVSVSRRAYAVPVARLAPGWSAALRFSLGSWYDGEESVKRNQHILIAGIVVF